MSAKILFDATNKLQMEIESLDKELKSQNKILFELFKEKKKYSSLDQCETIIPKDDNILFHYRYILPLVKEAHQLDLKIKEIQQRLDEKYQIFEAAKKCGSILAESLDKEDHLLQKYVDELRILSKDASNNTDANVISNSWSITNITFNSFFTEDNCLEEKLAFTVLHKGVHLRLQILSNIVYASKHFLVPIETRLGVNSDTYIEGLKEKVVDVINGKEAIADVVKFMSQFIEEEMAPYVIIVPMKKKKLLKKKTSPLAD